MPSNAKSAVFKAGVTRMHVPTIVIRLPKSETDNPETKKKL